MSREEGRPSKEEMERPPVELWKGWIFHEQAIWSPAGTRFSKRDVELSWQAAQIVDGFWGKRSNIRILRDKLTEERRLMKLPKVCFIWEDETGVSERVFDLKESH